MTWITPRALLALSLLLLGAVVVAWLVWPDDTPRSDLRAVAAVVATSTSTTAMVSPPVSTRPTTPAVPMAAAPVLRPDRVRVPAIGLDAPIVSVALEPDGQMEIPSATDVGWYRLGPAPGQQGSAVLAAHVDYGGQRGAFFDLRSAPVGAEVIVDGDGVSRRFTVTSREQVAKDDVQLGRYFTAEGPARIALITCGGAFDRGAGHYQDNIIITADLVP